MVVVITGALFLQGAAGASEPDRSTDTGGLIVECLANDGFVTIFGQVWNDVDGDERLLEDAWLSGVEVFLDRGPELPPLSTTTDEAGFWAYCMPSGEAAALSPAVNLVVPDGLQLVTPGAWPEDEDSDVVLGIDGTDAIAEAGTGPFNVEAEIDGRGRIFESRLEDLSIRIDAGFFEPEPFNPCPDDWNADLVDADPDSDWDGDGIRNAEDSLPCEEGIANPCPQPLSLIHI